MAISTQPFESDHSPQVAALFQKYFRGGNQRGSEQLARYLNEIFLDQRTDPDIRSIVAVDDHDKVVGFVGVFAQRMKWQGQSLRVAVASTLMARSSKENPFTGAKLIKAVVAGPQDLIVSETSNEPSLRMWRLVGGAAVPWCSLEFIRVLRPAALPFVLLSQRLPGRGVWPRLAVAADGVASMLVTNSYQPPQFAGIDAEASDEDIISCFAEFASHYQLRPELDSNVLCWRLRHADQKELIGTCHRRIVRNRRGKVAGCYIYHGSPGGRARTLQILANPGQHGLVLDAMLKHAYAQGCVVLHGRIDNDLIAPSLQRRCFYVSGSKTIVQSRAAGLVCAIQSGSAMLGGLAAETWTRLIGGRFA